MNNRQHMLRSSGPGLQVLLVMLLVLSAGFGKAPSVSAQEYGGMVIGAITCEAPNTSCRSEIGAQFTVTTEDGTYVGSCTLEGNPNDNSHVAACLVSFPFEITGTLIVTENVDSVSPGYAPEENPIFWSLPDSGTRPSHDVVFSNLPAGAGASPSETSNIAIVPTENGASVTDACFVLTTFGNVGCDDNADGKITFRDVPLGTYTVHQTADLGTGRQVNDFSITVTGLTGSDGWERFNATVISNSSSSSGAKPTAQEVANGGLWNMGIMAQTEGPGYSDYTAGAHFIVTSEDGEYIGECTFQPVATGAPVQTCRVDVPSDRISLVWEDLDSIPAGYAPVENPIAFDPTTYVPGPHNIGASFINVEIAGNAGIASSSAPAGSSGARDIALITRDPGDGHLLFDGCYILLEYGDEGCDENGDGQITYADVPLGVYTVHQTRTPSGFPTVTDFQITVAGEYPQVPLGYVVQQATVQNTPGTRNVSVVFVDSRTHTKVESSICVEFTGGSELACDDALVDGQIDFLDVPAGTYPIEFTGLPGGWVIPTGGMTGPTVTVDANSGAPPNQFVYVEVEVPGSATSEFGSTSGTTGSSGTSSSNPSASATLLMTFRGCPEGFDPAIQDFFANCMIPLDAPDASFIFWGAEGQGGMNIAWLERQYDGAYVYAAWPLTMNVELTGLAPVVRDAYQVVGADGVSGSTYTVHLVDGEVREVFVFYYYE